MMMMMLLVAVYSNLISTHSIEFSHPWSSPYCVANGNWILASTILEMWGCFRNRVTALANFWGMTTSTSTWNSYTCWVHVVTLSSVEINRPLSAPLATFGSGLCQVKKNIFIWCDDIDDVMATLKWIHSVPFLSFHHILKSSGQFLQVLPLKRGRDLATRMQTPCESAGCLGSSFAVPSAPRPRVENDVSWLVIGGLLVPQIPSKYLVMLLTIGSSSCRVGQIPWTWKI